MKSLLIISTLLMGCGFKELPDLKIQADKSFKEVLLQYRLRADLMPHFLKLIENRKDPKWTTLHSDLKSAHSGAVNIDMPPEKFDERQMNRLASFQYALSTQLVRFIGACDQDEKISKDGEYRSLKEQLVRAEARIAEARRKFLVDGPTLNERLAKIPEKWFNKFLYKYEPTPALQ